MTSFNTHPDITSPYASAYMHTSRERLYFDDDEDVASLPSDSASDSSLEAGLSVYSDETSDAEAEWRESMQQLEMLLTMVAIPFVGKFLGRKCAYWGWAKLMNWKYPVKVVLGNNAVPWTTGVPKVSASL